MILLVKNVGILTLKDIFIFIYPCQNIYFLFFILQYEYVWSPSYSGHNSKISSFVGKTVRLYNIFNRVHSTVYSTVYAEE